MKKNRDTILRGWYRLPYRKEILMAKMILILVCCICLQSYGNKSVAQKVVSLTIKKQNLKQVLEAIEKQTKTTFIYNDEAIKGHDVLQVRLDDVALDKALKEILLPFNLSYKQLDADRFLINVAQQEYQIQGRILDRNGNPLVFVNVSEVSQKSSTQTDANGYFLLRVHSTKPVIRITHLGYETHTFVIDYHENAAQTKDDKFKFVITMESRDNVLDSVLIMVNTGYQRLPKERSTGSFGYVTGDQIKNKTGSANVIDRLEGLVAGLSFNYGQGNDKLLMRGASSVNLERQPLVVLDGVPIDQYTDLTSLVNAQDVKDITVLKDATAASIWGARAANGVIVISTHAGEFDQEKIKIAYDGSVSFRGTPDYSYMGYMDSRQFIQTNKQIFEDPAYLAAFPLSTILNQKFPILYPHDKAFYDLHSNAITEAQYEQKMDSLASSNNRPQIEENFMRTSLWTNHNINFSGGGKSNRFFASLGYLRQDNTDRTKRDRYNFSIKEEWNIGQRLNMDLTGNMSYEKYDKNLMIFPNSLDTYLPYALFMDESGRALDHSYLYMTDDYRQQAMQKSKLDLHYVPLEQRRQTSNAYSRWIARINGGLRYTLADGLNFNARGQYQKSVDNGNSFYDENHYRVQLERIQFTQVASTPEGNPTYYLPKTGGHYLTAYDADEGWTFRGQFDYNKKLGSDHQLTALAGVETRSSLYTIRNTNTKGYDLQTMTYGSFDTKFLETTGLASPALPLSSGTGTQNKLFFRPLVQAESEIRFVSLYSNAAYSYQTKYHFNGSLRFDQSNQFGDEISSQKHPIWSTGLSWNIHKEDFFDLPAFNELTLRSTYGITGNSPRPGLGGSMDVLYATTDSRFDGLGTGYIVISPANRDLIWEKTKTWNMAVDFGLWNGRLKGSIDYYSKSTSDLLGDRPIDPTSGWTTAYGNLGNLYNRGIELTVAAAPIHRESFKWQTQFNLAYNKNKVTSLKRYNKLSALGKANSSFVEGYSAFSLFGLDYAGLNAEGNPQVYAQDGTIALKTNQITVDDVYYQGTTQPLWYGGMTNTFTYKDLSLSFLTVFNLGYVMRNELNTFFSGRLSNNISRVFEDRWQKPGDENNTNIPKYVPNVTTSNSDRVTDFYKFADINVVSASYIKLRDLTLSYDLARLIGRNTGVRQIKVYGQLNNLLLWTKNKTDIDPEYFDLSAGARVSKMPPFYSFGLNLSF